MAKRVTLPQLKKYDVTQKVIEMLADAESRAIIFSIIRKGKTAAELSEKHKIPLSSVYKKISDLEELTLIHVDSWQISEKLFRTSKFPTLCTWCHSYISSSGSSKLKKSILAR